MKALKAISIILIVCLLISLFGGIKTGTISKGNIILNIILIFANVIILLINVD